MSDTKLYKNVRVHTDLLHGETIFFEKFHEDVKTTAIFEEIINRRKEIIRIYIYGQPV